MFYDFSKSRINFSAAQGFEKCSFNKNGFWLGKSPDNIFYLVHINSGFSPHRGINLRKEGCRHMYKVNSAFKCRCCKSADISNYTATQVNEQTISIGFKIQHHFPNPNTKIDILVFFTGIDFDNVVINKIWKRFF